MEESNLEQNPPVIPTQQPIQPAQNQAVQTSQPANKSKLPMMLIIVFVLLIILGSGGYYFVNNSKLKSQNSNPPASRGEQLKSQNLTPTQTAILSPTPTIDPIANWKTYTSQNDGYTLKYPQGWTYKQNNPWQAGDIDFSNTNNDGQLFQILVNNDKVNLDTIAEDLSKRGNVSDVIIDGVTGKSVSFIMPAPPGNANSRFQLQEIHVVKNNKHYGLIIEHLEGASDRILNQILSTFRFVN